jgi:hypothetical protein
MRGGATDTDGDANRDGIANTHTLTHESALDNANAFGNANAFADDASHHRTGHAHFQRRHVFCGREEHQLQFPHHGRPRLLPSAEVAEP